MFELGVILSFVDFRALVVDLLDTYQDPTYSEELTLQDFLLSELEMILEQHQATRFIVFLPENFKETERITTYYVDAEGLMFLITEYLKV